MKYYVGDKVRQRNNKIVGTITDIGAPVAAVYFSDSSGGYTSQVPLSELILNLISEDFNTTITSGVCPEKETVAKPARYNTGSIEVWDAIKQLGADYLQGNVIKYTMRYKHKNKAEDLKKAMNYLAKMLAEETGEDYYELRKRSLDEL